MRSFGYRKRKHVGLTTYPLKAPRRLSENGYFPQSLCQAQIIILEILKCIPVVIIFAFLDLEKKFLILGQSPSV